MNTFAVQLLATDRGEAIEQGWLRVAMSLDSVRKPIPAGVT